MASLETPSDKVPPADTSPGALAARVRELTGAVSTLQATIVRLEAERAEAQATMRRLGMDVVTMARSLSDRLQAVEAVQRRHQEEQANRNSEALIAALASNDRPPMFGLRPALIVSVGLIAAAALIWGLPRLMGDHAPGFAAAQSSLRATNTPVVVLRDSPPVTGGAAAGSVQPPADSDAGHVLYGADDNRATGPSPAAARP